ncbi:LapA family protein [Phaeobacter sp. B1627]|uniref:LapA family protein n=1 Tax=Phaeobacter sp. B1627 TaxID=2583809 RepID=UPI00111AA6F4|nr:LapA family protein [Phaeobacter sp. B1627]TNJ39970.1 LapA family protein [Phaeobacter sp. B1627]
MRYIRYLVWGVLALVLVSVSLANRGNVTLKLMPEALAELAKFNLTMTLPLFAVVLGGIAIGVALGYVLEYLREHKHRREARIRQGEVKKLSREVKKLKRQKHEGKDEVLALLEDAS